MTLRHWILDENKRVVQADLLTWAKWFEKADNRIVKQEWVGNVWVSTVFLGIDHNFTGIGSPVLWETMFFTNRKELHYEMDRCSGNFEQAEAMHERMVKKAREAQNKRKDNNVQP